VSAVAGPALASLKKLGLRQDLERFVSRLQRDALSSESLDECRNKYALRPDVWADALRGHLNLAAGWLALETPVRAEPIFDAARAELIASSTMSLKKFAELSQAYLAAIGLGRAEWAVGRILDFFERVSVERIRNSFTTAEFFSRYHLSLAETVVLSLASEVSSAGRESRRWLEEDELLVRRKIHADVRRLVT
jgi:hypothetical protein